MVVLSAFWGDLPLAGPGMDVTVILDTEFLEEDWVVAPSFNNGSSETHERRLDGGNPGAYWHMEHTNPPTASLSVFHQLVAEPYDPAAQGAIGGIDYAVDRIEFDPPFAGAAIGARFVVYQDGRRYIANAVTAFTNTQWQLHRLECLKPEDFTPVNGELPDFSAAGSPLTFGFVRSNSNTSTVNSAVTKNGADNFRVVVYPESNTDCTGSPADVRVSKHDGDRQWAFDPVVPYEIHVVNTGGTAVAVTLTEIVPVNTRFQPDESTPGWACDGETSGSTCTLELGNVGAGQTIDVDFVVEVVNAIPIGFGLFNEASVDAGGEITAIEVTVPGPCDRDNPTSETLCGILCVLFPRTCDEAAGFGGIVASLVQRLTDATSENFDTPLLYRMRDRVMIETRGGRRATELFYQHSLDLARTVFVDGDVIGLGREALGAWESDLNALVAGDGADAIVAQEQIDAIDDFLDAVRGAAEDDLRSALDRERARLQLSDWVGISMTAALARLDRLTCSGFEDELFCGDLSGDCAVTATDALLALNMSVGLVGPRPEGDMDANGSVTGQDALRILRQGVGIDPPTTACNG